MRRLYLILGSKADSEGYLETLEEKVKFGRVVSMIWCL